MLEVKWSNKNGFQFCVRMIQSPFTSSSCNPSLIRSAAAVLLPAATWRSSGRAWELVHAFNVKLATQRFCFFVGPLFVPSHSLLFVVAPLTKD